MSRSTSQRCASARAVSWALLAFGLTLLGLACRSIARRAAAAPVREEAASALEEARAWARTPGATARERARAALERAVELAPDWVAPRRLADILAVDDLLGLEALAEHRLALEQRPDDALELYLVGRLEGASGVARFERAARLDPTLAWAHHGLGWAAANAGQFSQALTHAQRALSLARDGWERTYFVSTLARYYAQASEPRKAIAALVERLNAPDLALIDAVELGVQAASIELGLLFQPEYHSGWRRAIELLRECDLTDSEVEDLVRRMRVLRVSEASVLELSLALAARPGRARDRERARILLEQRPSALALGLLNRAAREGGEAPRAGPVLRGARFAAGQFREAVDEWLADLPRVVLDESGAPRDARLAQVVRCARQCSPGAPPEALLELGEALLDAGWFREARSVAAVLAAEDLDAALSLEDRAAAGQQLMLEWQRVVDRVDRRASAARALWDSGANASAVAIENLDGLLRALAPALSSARAMLGAPVEPARLAQELAESPRLRYGSLASVAHPGPLFSREDERAGLGVCDAPVPGLARYMDELGRFALFGELSGGGGPDGTILSRLHVSRVESEHLGAPFEGLVAWCEGADVASRAGRQGAEISGAALHEGYWVDIDTVRRERSPWERVAREFFDARGSERARAALESRGLELRTPRERAEQRRVERRDASILLGAADRVRLAVLLERVERGEAPEVKLDELVAITAAHEEGHLCDRGRFLPLGRNWLGALRLLAQSGFTPAGVARRLEYRAQLTALCVVEDPRLPLVAVLAAGDSSGPSLTPHAEAYRELLADLLARLDADLERDRSRWPALDPDRVLAHQLHRLGPEDVRRLALLTAADNGLVAR